MWGDSIEVSVSVDIDECLSEIGVDRASRYFGIGTYDTITPLECITSFKRAMGIKRPLMPEDLKKEICQFIDDNIYKCI